MGWKIDDGRPIWTQLKEQMIKRIVSGTYSSGEKLPSVRDLAGEAGVNPNTMQRALSALDQDGLTITNRTSGRCVTEDVTEDRRMSERYSTQDRKTIHQGFRGTWIQ